METEIILSILIFMFACISFIFARGESKHKCITDIKTDLSAIKTDINWIKKSMYDKN